MPKPRYAADKTRAVSKGGERRARMIETSSEARIMKCPPETAIR